MEKCQQTHGTLTLTGTGRVQAKPDLAMINLGVRTAAKTAQEAMTKNAELMNQVLNKMKTLGVPADDLQTIDFNITPQVDSDERSPTYNQVVGYQVEDTVAIRAPVTLVSRVLDEGIGAGANVVNSLSFGLRDDGEYRQRALQEAVKSAYRDAHSAAQAMGVSLQSVTSAEVLEVGGPITLRLGVREKLSSTPIETGSLTVLASVRMVMQYDGPANTLQG